MSLMRNAIIIKNLKKSLEKSHRLLSTKAQSTDKDYSPLKTRRKVKSAEPVDAEIMKYFSSPARAAALNYPESILKSTRKKNIDQLYIGDEETALKIANIVTENLPKDLQFIEVNPGLGMLTKHLAERENKLFLYENIDSLYAQLKSVYGNDPKISLKNGNFINVWKLCYLDKIDNGNRLEEFFSGIQRKNYEEDVTARVFACTGSISFFKDLINAVVFQTSFLSIGRQEYYFCVPPALYLFLTCSPDAGYLLYRVGPVLFQLLFEYELLAKFDCKHFLPWKVVQKPSTRLNKVSFDSDYIYLIKVVPRQNLFEYCEPHHLPALWFFLKQNLFSRSKQIIPTMERWVPGCGPRLIVNAKESRPPTILKEIVKSLELPDYVSPCQTISNCDFIDNLHIFSQFGKLTPSQIFTIFDEFVHWPEFESCAFHSMLEKVLVKVYANPEEMNQNELDLSSNEEELIEPKEN